MASALAFTGCQTVRGPQDVARAYARALEQGRVSDAYALCAPEGLDPAQFAQRYADPQVRQARARAVAQAADALTASGGALTLRQQGGNWRIDESVEACRAALRRFSQAALHGDFGAAYAELSSEVRARYTPTVLARDFRDEPSAAQRLERAQAAASQEPTFDGSKLAFPVGGGRLVRMVWEGGGCRVAALE